MNAADRPPERILILRLSALGDILHTLPAVAALRRHWPQCRIGWAVERSAAFLLENNPVVDRLHILDTRAARHWGSLGRGCFSLGQAIRAIRRERYQAAIDFQGLFKSSAVGLLAGIPLRIGHAAEFRREKASVRLINRPVRPDSSARHVIAQNCALTEALGIPTSSWQFPLPDSEREEQEIQDLLRAPQARSFVVLHPGAGWPTKLWPPHRWTELARRLRRQLDLFPLFTGGPGEASLLSEIVSPLPPESYGLLQISFMQLVPLLRRARLFIGGDTGPMQLACAVGAPTVAIFGPSTPQRNGPFHADDISVHHPLPCSHCYFRRCPHRLECMDISVEEVYAAAEIRLQQIDSFPGHS